MRGDSSRDGYYSRKNGISKKQNKAQLRSLKKFSLTEPQETKSKTFKEPGVLGKDCTKKRQLNKNE